MSVFIIIGTVEGIDQKSKLESKAKRKGKMIENINLGIMHKLAKVWLGEKESPLRKIKRKTHETMVIQQVTSAHYANDILLYQ